MWSKATIPAICITILTLAAILKGIDGAVLATAFTALGGLGGYALHAARKPK